MADTIHNATAAKFIDWDRLDQNKFADEEKLVADMLAAAPMTDSVRAAAVRDARALVETARKQVRKRGMVESFLDEFGLTNQEGLALMCLAEALLRVPDAETRDDLIAEKIRSGDWGAHAGQADSWLVNASTWGLMLTGKVIGAGRNAKTKGPGGFLQGLVRESGEPVIRAAMMQAMRIMGEQFVLGRTVDAALKRGRKMVKAGEAAHFSFDMLGEGARTTKDAERYMAAYARAIAEVGADKPDGLAPEHANGVSVKLSALHPRYSVLHEDRVMAELYPKLKSLADQAAAAGINLCLDAEEADRLVLSLRLLERLAHEASLGDWSGLGLAVQAYQKRAKDVIGRLSQLSETSGRRLMVRLVKGAYWDTEIKRAQTEGHADFPVFTTKPATDLSYLACAREMLAASPRIYPQFATHNAHTLAAVRLMADEAGVTAYEFQRLHGMGEPLYEAAGAGGQVRIYAPVGEHEDLLPYLVRRLLENGANTSFVHTFLDPDVPVETVVEDPIARLEAGPKRHARIPAPPFLYGEGRRNSAGLDLTQAAVRAQIGQARERFDAGGGIAAGPIISGHALTEAGRDVFAPHDTRIRVGSVRDSTTADVDAALKAAAAFQPEWDACGGTARARHLRAMGDALEADMVRLMVILSRETGKTLADGIAEVREAVDFLRYYAVQAETRFGAAERLPGPSGETNHLSLHGRGVFACISPWNFPLAIFTGQVAAALGAGNTVVAKPAEQSPLIAFEAVRLFQAAGLPKQALHLLPGPGETVGAALTKDRRVAGVAFTGGTSTARRINQTLAGREGAIIPLIAETGGLNAMFVDTTALREQVIDDILVSAFGSAGQRCSALRIAFLPKDTADFILDGLKGAMDELKLGDPIGFSTDVGPVIDAEACAMLNAHIDAMAGGKGTVQRQLDAGEMSREGHGFGPALVEIQSLDEITEEKFGPVLHILRYDPDDVETVGAQLHAKGYGLTLGIHSRLETFRERVRLAVPVGNTYVNRSMTGAVVGVQPFGGEGLSGTGPKAGGPNYMIRFGAERVMTINITAQGGDPELLNL